MKMRQSQKPTVKTKTDVVLKYAAIGLATAAIIFAVIFIYSNFINTGETRAEVSEAGNVGAGYALELNGTSDYIALPPALNSSGLLRQFTAEVWIKTTGSAGGRDYTILDFDGKEYFSLYSRGNGKLSFKTTDSNKNRDVLVSTTKVNDGEWHHVAAVYNGVDKLLYIDGKLNASISNPHNGNAIGTGKLRFGFIGVASEASSYDGTKSGDYFEGSIDELRVWVGARTEDQIRQKLTERLVGNEAQLFSYLSFDEGQGSVTQDMVRGFTGELKGGLASTGWTLSGIYMGDQSVYEYNSNQLTYSIPGKGAVTVNITSGTPEGIHIYYVGSAPNDNTLPNGIKGFESFYWGVYVMGNTEYTFSYDFSGYTGPIAPEYMELVKRPNGNGAWVHGNGQRGSATDIAIPLQNGTEYIPASSETVMPIELMSFEASVDGSDVVLEWSTSSEINNDFFTIERSKNGKDYEEVGRLDGSGNTEEVRSYTFVDPKPVQGRSYYRLKQTDFDGQYEYFAPKLVEVASNEVREVLVSVFPNPSLNQVITVSAEGIGAGQEVVVGMMGLQGNPVFKKQLVTDEGGFVQVKIDPSNMSAGNYLIVLKTADDKFTKQLILRK